MHSLDSTEMHSLDSTEMHSDINGASYEEHLAVRNACW